MTKDQIMGLVDEYAQKYLDGYVEAHADFHTPARAAVVAALEGVSSVHTQAPAAWIGDSPTKGNGKQLFWTKGEAYEYANNIQPLYTAQQPAEPQHVTEVGFGNIEQLPDCRTCEHIEGTYCSHRINRAIICVGGDQYQAAPAVVLWMTK